LSFPTATLQRLYARLLASDDGRRGVDPPATLLGRRALFLHAQNGVGHAHRTVSAAGAFVVALGRVLALVWPPDAHAV